MEVSYNQYDPDIQNAPVYLESFYIKNNNDWADNPKPFIILNQEGNADFKVNFTIFLPQELINKEWKEKLFVFLSLISVGKKYQSYLTQLYSPLPLNKSQYVSYSIPVRISSANLQRYTSDAIRLQLSVSPDHQGSAGFGESLRIGRFLNTVIPLEETNNG